MKFIADLHIHSKYSRATSKDLNFEQLFYWAQLKGIQVIGTGDFVHPGWFGEIKEKLEPAEYGFFKLKEKYSSKIFRQVPQLCRKEIRFVLSAEISNIYKKNEKVRKVHNIIFAPDLDAAQKIQNKLNSIGNIKSDGRPILGLDSRDLLEIVLESHEKSFLIPAHIWTPWFSVLGSKSGFDSIEECYGDLSKHIFALETGLSSDPLMNWRLSILDPYILISNSDAHSASKLGREANIFDADFSYTGIYNSLSDPNDKGLLGTIEFYPEEGKYHYDGHSACKQRMAPNETIASKGLCPVCGKKVTVGVMARVEALADRKQGEKSKRPREFKNLIPLCEIIADAKGMKSTTSKTVEECYYALLNKLGNELFILQDASIKEIAKISTIVSEGIKRVRQKKVLISPGYDGEYGKIKLFEENERNNKESQFALF